MGNKLSSLFSRQSQMPVVVVLGATGTGKSKLAIQLAQRFSGEIISADSMQVYKGLDIVTNKVTEEEKQGIPHHFLGFTDPLKKYTVVDFQNQALPLLHNLLSSKKLPIIVGGTNYYIESLLWDVLLKTGVYSDTLLLEAEKKRLETVKQKNLSSEPSDSGDSTGEHLENCNPKDLFKVPITQNSFKNIPSPLLHKALLEVDPAMASSLHPNDKRKIVRSLQVYQQLQLRHSDLLSQQKSQRGGSCLGGPLRLKNAVMLWLQCEKTVLNTRLDERVDEMVKNGLLEELIDFHRAYNELRLQNNQEPNYEEGIFQSIGFKEFHQYLTLSKEEQASENGKKLLNCGIEDMKLHTRQYARKQSKWITNRLLKTPNRDVPPIYGLDATNLDLWEQNVFDVASRIVESQLQGQPSPVPPLPQEKREENVPVTNYCDICDQVIVGSLTWEIHLNSRSHRRMKASLNKKKAASACTSE